MSEVRELLAYSGEHEWVLRLEGQTVRIGITDYAQIQLGDIVFVEFPEAGAEVTIGDSIGTIESVKTVSDLYCPLTGTVTKVNESLVNRPELVNEEPYDGGWMVELEVDGSLEEAFSKLLTAEAYRALID